MIILALEFKRKGILNCFLRAQLLKHKKKYILNSLTKILEICTRFYLLQNESFIYLKYLWTILKKKIIKRIYSLF